MAAAMATLDVLEADNSAAMAHMQAMGSMLSEGLAAQAESHGVPIKVCGPSAMPLEHSACVESRMSCASSAMASVCTLPSAAPPPR